jgi:hypothetical protein
MLTYKLFDGSKELRSWDVPETETMQYRGCPENGGTVVDIRELHVEGERKRQVKGLKRFMSDGAPSVIEVPIPQGTEKNPIPIDKAWDTKAILKLAGCEKVEKKAAIRVNGTGVKKLAESKATGAKELHDIADAGLTALAKAFSEKKRDEMYSGDITEGNITALAPEVHKLRTLILNDYLKVGGIKAKDVGKLPGTTEGLKAHYVATAIPLPKKAKGHETRFAVLLAEAERQVKADREALDSLAL